MSNIQNIIIAALVVILIIITVAFAITVLVKNNTIKSLKDENKILLEQIGAANISIKFQNEKIAEMELNVEKNEEIYKTAIKSIRDNYTKKLNNITTYKSCEDILAVISKNQKEFMYDK